MEVVISSTYQISIPKAVRKQLDLQPGHKLLVIVKDGVVRLIPDRPLHELRAMFRGMDGSDIREDGE